jgi:hypothetical protein
VSDAWVKEQDTLDKYLWRQNIVSGGPQTIPADIVTENVGLDPVDLITAYAKIHKQKPLVFREWSRDNPGPIDYISTNRSFLSSPVSAYLWEPVLRLFDRRCQIDYRLTKERAQRICRLVEATAVPGKPLVVICRGPLIFRLVIAGLGRQGWYCPYRGAWLTFFKKRKWFY